MARLGPALPGIAVGEIRVPGTRRVGLDAPWRWLARGWDDFRATGFRGAFYGAAFALAGAAIALVYRTHWQFALGLMTGFFLLGPCACAGIYELSRQRERGQTVSLARSLRGWRRNPGSLAFFAAILGFATLGWARTSAALFALFSGADFPTLHGVLAHMLGAGNHEFLLVWVGVGFVFASLVYAVSVVSVPLMLDRRSDTMAAIFASVFALLANAAALYLWAALIVLAIGASLLLWLVPLVVTAPLIGHASWHAYRDLVEAN